MFLCVAVSIFLFFPLMIPRVCCCCRALLILTADMEHCASWQLSPSADACDGLLCCFRRLWIEQQAHTDTDSSLIHVLKPVHQLVSFFFLFASPHSVCTFPRRTGWKSFVPRNVFTSCPLTRQHTHSCTQTHTHTNSVQPLISTLQAIPSASVGHAPSSQPRRGTFGSSFSGKKQPNKAKKTKKKQNVRCYFLSTFVSLSRNSLIWRFAWD